MCCYGLIDELLREAPGNKPANETPHKIPKDDGTEIGSQWNDDHVTDIYNDCDLYLAAKNGNLSQFSRILARVASAEKASFVEILRRLSPALNTFLHVAAKHGNENTVTYVAAKSPSLTLHKNSNGDTALHVAARAGDESVVKALVEGSGAEVNNLLRATNQKGNTALHEALISGQEIIARFLIQQDSEVSYYKNKIGECAIYLAAKVGFANCVSLILTLSTDQQRLEELFKKKSPIEAAIMEKHRDVLESILNSSPQFIQIRDEEGRTPLHYAASLGNHAMVRHLLDKYAPSATQRDKNGSFPIHLAAIKGHVDIISLLLQDFPDPGELLNWDGCNILHLAAQNGRSNIVSHILNNPDLNELINMKDKRGNVPLHLATMNWHSEIVYALTWDKRVDIKAVNDEGMTALDAAESSMLPNPTYLQRLTWAALKAAGTPLSLPRKSVQESSNMEICKERVNNLLRVSTIVATMTFAASFTMPGGYTSSGTDRGVATMLREKAFHIFVFCVAIAMHSSCTVAVSLIWAQLGDLTLVLNALTLAEPLIGIALSMMSMAFTAGVFLEVSKLRWLGTAVLVIGATFLAMLLVLLLPLCAPITSSNPILRYLSYYPFRLLIFATTRNRKDLFG
ncbi:hypothetical protein BUALT_Bualt18G0026200 [Buddleja alternifolia]|uniref:PGG domain-containing protein n=1 Tax=Buddleja alternifolia TaxID=168488 RepID=A0AAV6WCC3_9LAMI|nr:hypothetical protein BUALT_Bualt18G0026200 [Buddleja alternifolia]